MSNVFKSKEIQDKIKQTNLEKYGVENPMQNKAIQEKVTQTNIKKYGVENPMQNEEVRGKARNSWLKTWEQKTLEEKESIVAKFKETMLNKTPEERKATRRKANKHNSYKAQDGETFDSNWELLYYEYCKSKGLNIKREPVELDYFFEGKVHHYYPDFEVDGKLIEIKGSHLGDSEGTWVCPYKDKNHSEEYMNGLYEAKHQCALSNNVTILYKEDLIQLGVL